MITKFVILSYQRSGTFLIKTSLDSHPAIRTSGEYINKIKKYNNGGYYDVIKETSMEEICENAFKPNTNTNLAVGLIQHRIHHDDVMFIDYLINNKDIKIIFVDRENALRRFISNERSISTEKWRYHKSLNQELDINTNTTIEFNYTKFINSVTCYNERRQFYLNKFKDHNMLFITYEKLTNDYDNELANIQNFLNVPVLELHPDTIKISIDTLKNSVSNYLEMEQHLIDNNLQHYLDDEIEKNVL